MEPNLGQGACQAIKDAVALGMAAATGLARGDPGAVPVLFEAMRLPRVRRVVARAAEGGYAMHGPVIVQAVMRGLLRVMPETLKERVAAGVQAMPDYR